MKIVRLTAENVLRLVAVDIAPTGHVVTIAGKNGAGKSSVLDAIAMAIGGAKLCPDVPVRRGEKKGKIVVDLGDYLVTRTFTAEGGGTLTVAAKDGAKYPSPQALLDKLIGSLTFDPLAFAALDAPRQAATLRQLAGLDFADLEQQRRAAYDERRVVNALVAAKKARLSALPPRDETAPAEELSVSALTQELEQIHRDTQEVEGLQRVVDAANRAALAAQAEVATAQSALAELRKAVARAEQTLAAAENRHASAAANLEKARDNRKAAGAPPDPGPLRAKIADADRVNQAVRANAARAALERELKDAEETAAAKTADIERANAEQTARLAAAVFPIAGLTVDGDRVLFNDLPLTQASTAERLRVSVAIGLALNPTLRVLLVKAGNDLDDDGLRLLAEMAEQADAQVWLEAIRGSGESSVRIEDGRTA